MKHKHAELIHAWADGAVIEYFSKFEERWKVLDAPTWFDFYEYRVKPEPMPDVALYVVVGKRNLNGAYVSIANEEINNYCNLKLIFDGETRDLKFAEVIK